MKAFKIDVPNNDNKTKPKSLMTLNNAMNILNKYNFHSIIDHDDFMTKTTESDLGSQIQGIHSNYESFMMSNKYKD